MRDPDFTLEIVGSSMMKENREPAFGWSRSLWEDLQQVDTWNLLPGTYISLDPPSEAPGRDPLSNISGPMIKRSLR